MPEMSTHDARVMVRMLWQARVQVPGMGATRQELMRDRMRMLMTARRALIGTTDELTETRDRVRELEREAADLRGLITALERGR